ncbi:hypothetical protein Asi02nite_70360 [Asanoa siamensis]|uniref:Antitoxin protein of toxin-antitoxin system n=2 Tax=Asanoa siamensis TaxID=926357 RepID=A0ABQ4D1U9_9ACTN|nr:hypothetical protein Asi02nite_70360 [Asanoa siamensis]
MIASRSVRTHPRIPLESVIMPPAPITFERSRTGHRAAMSDFMDKAKDYAEKNDDKVDEGAERAGELVDKRVDDKYDKAIDKGVDEVQQRTRGGDTV